MTEQLYKDLLDALGPKGVLRASQSQPFLTDMQGFHSGIASIVARPSSTEEVSQTVQICAKHKIAIVPQGGNTGLCGGAMPQADHPAIILSLARMNQILSVDPACYTITVEAGSILQSIHDAANAVDRDFALDWGARGSAMVGGAISTNGGGLNVLRYGTTREQVLGLEVVLPDGRIWNGLRALRKDASGYDLKQNFIGGEGTLGVITKACLKLHPLLPINRTMIGAINDFSRLMELLALARNSGGEALTAFELLPGEGVRRVAQVKPAITLPIKTDAEWCIMIRYSGRDQEKVDSDLLALFETAFEKGLLSDAVVSQSLAQEQNLWHMRDEIPPEKLFDGKMIKWDVSVPIHQIPDFIAQAKHLLAEQRPQGRFYAFGHAGDGNLHTIIFPGGSDQPDFKSVCNNLYGQMDALVWKMGGSICAEHGVGIENVDRLTGQKSAIELEMMHKLKNLFDPETRMNPGKLIRG